MGEVVSEEELIEAQKADCLCHRVLNRLASGVACTRNADGFDAYLLGYNGLLLRYIPQLDDEEAVSPPFRVVVLRTLGKRFMRYFHGSALEGHGIGRNSYEKLCRVATWPEMRRNVLSYSRSCLLCQVAKPRGAKPVGFMNPVESSYPRQVVACDVMGPLPWSARGN